MQGGEREQEPLPRARDGTRTARRAEKESAENLAEARVEAAQQVEEARKEGFMEGQAAGLERVRSHLESLVKKAGELQDNEEVRFNSSSLLKWLAKEQNKGVEASIQHYQEVGEMYKEKAMAGSAGAPCTTWSRTCMHNTLKACAMEDFFADTCTLDSK